MWTYTVILLTAGETDPLISDQEVDEFVEVQDATNMVQFGGESYPL